MWVLFGISAGAVLGLYDFWTKRAMAGNSVLPVVFWSSLFGALAWTPAFFPGSAQFGVFVDVFKTSFTEQGLILIKSLAMTLSWLFAYYSVRDLPMSFSGAVRASGPIWTFLGGAILFGEMLTPMQIAAVLVLIFAYYILSVVGKDEGIDAIRSGPMLMMLVATILSAMTTVYDKFIVQKLNAPIYAVQAYSAFDRCALALVILAIASYRSKLPKLQWSISVPLVGLAWVVAELIYFFAIADPSANVTYLSIFRRTSLVVGFLLSVTLIGERSVRAKSIVIILIVLSTAVLILEH
jgi:drug/metabolite transporter (DMT)-like permease